MNILKFKDETEIVCIKSIRHNLYIFTKGKKYKIHFNNIKPTLSISSIQFLIIWDDNNRSLAIISSYSYLNDILECFTTLHEYRRIKVNYINGYI